MTDDEDLSFVLRWARVLGITVHVRGTDEKPVVEVRDKLTRKVVGGSELRGRIARHERLYGRKNVD